MFSLSFLKKKNDEISKTSETFDMALFFLLTILPIDGRTPKRCYVFEIFKYPLRIEQIFKLHIQI